MTTYESIAKVTGKNPIDIARALRGFSMLERRIIQMRFAPTTITDTANALGVDPQTVVEIEQQVLSRLA